MLEKTAFVLSCCFQAFLMIYAGTVFYGINLSRQRLGLIALSFGVGIVLIRNFYIYTGWPMGTHTLVLMALLVILAAFIGQIRWPAALGLTFFTFCLLLVGSVVGGAGLLLFHIDPQTSVNNIWLNILFANLTENLFLIIYIVTNRFFKFSIHSFGMNNRG